MFLSALSFHLFSIHIRTFKAVLIRACQYRQKIAKDFLVWNSTISQDSVLNASMDLLWSMADAYRAQNALIGNTFSMASALM